MNNGDQYLSKWTNLKNEREQVTIVGVTAGVVEYVKNKDGSICHAQETTFKVHFKRL